MGSVKLLKVRKVLLRVVGLSMTVPQTNEIHLPNFPLVFAIKKNNYHLLSALIILYCIFLVIYSTV